MIVYTENGSFPYELSSFMIIKCKSSGYDIKANYMGNEFHLRWVYTDKTGKEFLDKMKEAYIRGDTTFEV